MSSPHLQAERERLLIQITAIRESGEVAPPNVRIEPDFLNSKCWLLTHTTLPMRERQLGRSDSGRYQDWVGRIERRDRLQELEYELSLVEQLLERQAKTEGVFLPTVLPSEGSDAPLGTVFDFGDMVEFEGQEYQVADVGSDYLQLTDATGVVIRCEPEQVKLLVKG